MERDIVIGQSWSKIAPADTGVGGTITVTWGTEIPAEATKLVITGISTGSTAAGATAARYVIDIDGTVKFAITTGGGGVCTNDIGDIYVILKSSGTLTLPVVTFTFTIVAGTVRPSVRGYYVR